MTNSSSEAVARRAARVRPFVYRDPHGSGAEVAPLPPASATVEEAESLRKAQARNEARREVEQELRAQFERRLESERAMLRAALEGFEAERRKYFQQLERDVVNLSLALARKVLRREAQIDPLLLTGAVRVALDQLSNLAEVELRVAPSQLARWEVWLKELGLAVPPALRGDAALEPNGCQIVAATGSTDLSLDVQLAEIERGVMELVERRVSG